MRPHPVNKKGMPSDQLGCYPKRPLPQGSTRLNSFVESVDSSTDRNACLRVRHRVARNIPGREGCGDVYVNVRRQE